MFKKKTVCVSRHHTLLFLIVVHFSAFIYLLYRDVPDHPLQKMYRPCLPDTHVSVDTEPFSRYPDNQLFLKYFYRYLVETLSIPYRKLFDIAFNLFSQISTTQSCLSQLITSIGIHLNVKRSV